MSQLSLNQSLPVSYRVSHSSGGYLRIRRGDDSVVSYDTKFSGRKFLRGFSNVFSLEVSVVVRYSDTNSREQKTVLLNLSVQPEVDGHRFDQLPSFWRLFLLSIANFNLYSDCVTTDIYSHSAKSIDSVVTFRTANQAREFEFRFVRGGLTKNFIANPKYSIFLENDFDDCAEAFCMRMRADFSNLFQHVLNFDGVNWLKAVHQLIDSYSDSISTKAYSAILEGWDWIFLDYLRDLVRETPDKLSGVIWSVSGAGQTYLSDELMIWADGTSLVDCPSHSYWWDSVDSIKVSQGVEHIRVLLDHVLLTGDAVAFSPNIQALESCLVEPGVALNSSIWIPHPWWHWMHLSCQRSAYQPQVESFDRLWLSCRDLIILANKFNLAMFFGPMLAEIV
jgi:hypothetical protein